MSEFLEIHHLSASNINLFITNRAAWFCRYFKKMPFIGNLNMHRGTAVEAGIVSYLDNNNITEAISAAVKKYDELIIGLQDDLEYRQSIGPLVKIGIEGNDDFAGYHELIAQYGKPSTQEKIEIKLDGCSINVIGYLDFAFKKKIIDNKVTGKTPSRLTQGYILQGAIYKKATGLPVSFLFEVANKKPAIKVIPLTDEEYEFGIKLATKAAIAIETIVNNPIDGQLMEAFMFADPDGGYGGDEQKEVCRLMGL